jgi:hypothetical protein
MENKTTLYETPTKQLGEKKPRESMKKKKRL